MKPLALFLMAAVAGCGLLHGQGTVSALPVALTFSWQLGAVIPGAQTVALKITAGTPIYATSTPPGDQWLIVTPTSGNLPGTLSVRVNPSTLSAGIYVSAIAVVVTGVGSPLSIPVTVTVTLPPGTVAIAPATLPLTSPGTLTGTFTITAGSAPATFSIASSVPWVTASPAVGAILTAATLTITLTANPASLSPQTAAYPAKLTVTTNSSGVAKTQTVTVNMTVNAQLPVVASVWPAVIPAGSPDTAVTLRGANFYSGTTVMASGSATALKLTLVSDTVLLAVIPAPLLTATGFVNLTVANPAPGGAAVPYSVSIGNTPSITAITNAASYALGAISPGEMIAIFGQNLGPTAPAQMTVSGGYAQTSAGGVSVTIDGQSAPILYASDSQVTVQVPYNAQLGSLANGTQRAISLTYGAGVAGALTDIVAEAPAIFSLNASGTGAAIVLNFDPVTMVSSINSKTNPAKIGTTVTFFMTGEGDYAIVAYSPETGFMVPATPPAFMGAYPQLASALTVTMGGKTATTVSYAGPIPTCMLGLLQINVVVPAGATTGGAVPLVVNIGAGQSQAGITIALAP